MKSPPRRSKLVAGTAAAIIALSLAACSTTATAKPAIDPKADASKVTGTITVMRNPGEITEAVISEFGKKYPKIKIDAIDYDAVKLKSLQAAGSPPDIFRVEGPAVPTLVAQGQLMDLTAPLGAIGIKSDTTYKAADLYVVNGKRYGLPKDWSPDFNVYINNAAFKSAGITIPDPATPLSWNEIRDMAKKLTVTSGSATTQFGLGGAWDSFSPARVISAALAENNEFLYSKDEKSINLASNPKAMKVLGYMADLAKDGVTHSPVNPSASWSGDEFTKGKVAMVVYGYWFNAFINKGDTAVGTNYTVLPAPYWTSAANRVNPTITGTGYVMSSKTANAQAAWTFLSWYLSGDQAKARATAGFGFPALKANTNLLPQDTAVNKQAFGVVSIDAKRSPALQFNKYYDDSVFTNSYNKNLQDYIKGSLTVDSMARTIEVDVNAAIKDGIQQTQ